MEPDWFLKRDNNVSKRQLKLKKNVEHNRCNANKFYRTLFSKQLVRFLMLTLVL